MYTNSATMCDMRAKLADIPLYILYPSLYLSMLNRTMCTSTYPHLFLTSVVKTLLPKSCHCLISSFSGNILLDHATTTIINNKMAFHFQKMDLCQHFEILMIENGFTQRISPFLLKIFKFQMVLGMSLHS